MNYEIWQWSMTGEQVAAAFTDYLRSEEAVQTREL